MLRHLRWVWVLGCRLWGMLVPLLHLEVQDGELLLHMDGNKAHPRLDMGVGS